MYLRLASSSSSFHEVPRWFEMMENWEGFTSGCCCNNFGLSSSLKNAKADVVLSFFFRPPSAAPWLAPDARLPACFLGSLASENSPRRVVLLGVLPGVRGDGILFRGSISVAHARSLLLFFASFSAALASFSCFALATAVARIAELSNAFRLPCVGHCGGGPTSKAFHPLLGCTYLACE